MVPNVVLLTAESKKLNFGTIEKIVYGGMKGSTGSSAFMKTSTDSFLWGYDDQLLNKLKTFLPGDVSHRFGMLMSVSVIKGVLSGFDRKT